MSTVVKDWQNNIFILLRDGREYTHGVSQEQPVRLVRFTSDEEVKLKPALLDGKPYPVHRACERLLKFGEAVGITEGAKRALEEELKKEADNDK